MRESFDTYDLAREALAFIPSDCDRESWLRIGMAINSEWPDARGFATWEWWSKRSPKKYADQDQAIASCWKSFTPGGEITLGTIFGIAKQNGWDDPRKRGGSAHENQHNTKGRSIPPAPAPAPQSDSQPQDHHEAAPAPEIAPAEPKTYPPKEDLDALLKLCVNVSDDVEASRWCALRKLDAGEIDYRGDARVLAYGAAPRAPQCAPSVPVSPRQRLFGRLLIPLYDHTGEMRSVSGRVVDPAQTSAGVSSYKIKASRPTGYKAAGLCMMNSTAHALVTRGEDDIPPTDSIIIVEGEPDFLTRCQTQPGMAVFGIYSGSWKPEIASRIPSKVKIYIETDRDKSGDAYAQKIVRSLAGSACSFFRLRADLPQGDINDLHVRGALLHPGELCAPYAREEQAPAAPTPPAPPVDAEAAPFGNSNGKEKFWPRTDLGNGERLAYRFGATHKWCWEQAQWYVWDGCVWRKDAGSAIERAAKETVRRIYEEARDSFREEEAKAYSSWANACQSRRKMRDMIACAQSDERMVITADKLDQDPWKITVSNGTIDLHTGKLEAHRREDYITRIAQVEYDPNADQSPWTGFLDSICVGREDLPGFIRLAVGYSLTGDVSEEVLFFVHGPGGSGKSTFIEALTCTFGEYAATADFETFVKRPSSNGPREDVASLIGARFVKAVEVDEGKHLAEGLVKSITGGDTIRARFLYSKSFEAKPQFKLWLVANDRPKVRDTDKAMFRRIRVIPFTSEIPESQRDNSIKRFLNDREKIGPAILAWAVEGCLEWQASGLKPTKTVITASAEYQESMNPLGEFINDLLIFGKEKWVKVKNLRSKYEEWAEEAGEKDKYLIGPQKFNERLEARGCVRKVQRVNGVPEKVWVGVGLRMPSDTDEAMQDEMDFGRPSYYGHPRT